MRPAIAWHKLQIQQTAYLSTIDNDTTYNAKARLHIFLFSYLQQKHHFTNITLLPGHDLDLQNQKYFAQKIPGLLEVSIGHALVCDAIYLGYKNTVQMYKRCLK